MSTDHAPEASMGEAASYAALHEGVVARERPVEVVTVTGPQALSYLESQCTQQLTGLEVGASRLSLLLSPQGKLDVAARVVRIADEEIDVVVDAGYGGVLLERLARFKLRVKAQLTLAERCLVELRGPDALALSATVEARAALGVEWPGFEGVDLLDPLELPGTLAFGAEAAFERARVEAGVAVMGQELSERTIPQEAGLVARFVSMTKGCYPGQELVARIDARGNRVPRRLRLLRCEDGEALSADDALFLGDKEVGTVTSVGRCEGASPTVALAYLRREVEAPARLTARHEGAAISVQALPLPGELAAD